MDTLSRRTGLGTCMDSDDPLLAWRRHVLEGAGFDTSTARAWADCPGLDLHALLTLVDSGCPPALAARILAPVEQADA